MLYRYIYSEITELSRPSCVRGGGNANKRVTAAAADAYNKQHNIRKSDILSNILYYKRGYYKCQIWNSHYDGYSQKISPSELNILYSLK